MRSSRIYKTQNSATTTMLLNPPRES